MPYNSLVSRADSQALVPEEVSNILLTNLMESSAVIALSRKARISTNQVRMPVLATLPSAYWVTGDTGLKQTTDMTWSNKYLDVEELAVIVPIPEAVLDDTAFNMWGEIRPACETAISRAFDEAVLFGVNKPASWPAAIAVEAEARGHTVTRGTATAAQGGVAEDLNDAMAMVEADGYDVNGFIADRTYRALLRGARDTTGQKLLDVSTNEIEGAPLRYVTPGLWPTGADQPEMILGDWEQSIVGIRQDITAKVLDQAVISDNTGAIIYNLAQQDMVALRLVFRVAWQIGNTLNFSNETEATRYPWSILEATVA